VGSALSNGVVSLGDGGTATLTFKNPIRNGNGWDFAVFENSFLDSFLELAFVEVSSDGNKFVRFPSESLSDTLKQTTAFGYTKPEKVNNLAGKYIAGYGTPFDLEELKDSVGIDINSIKFVRIRDVVGSINTKYATRDTKGRKINDPWPTRFPSSGFDLDAIGVIHENLSAKTHSWYSTSSIKIWPNPVDNDCIHVESNGQSQAALYNLLGNRIRTFFIADGENLIHIGVPPGMYFIVFTNTQKEIYSIAINVQ
jgi:hypothetical protein